MDFKDVPVCSNSMGFRGPEITQERPANTVRIVGLGDSVMFGWGVRQEECYLAQLQDLLSAAYPQKTWEVINTGVPGYNTVMEVATMRAKGLATVPTTIGVERSTNPFLRADDPAFQRAIGMEGADPVAVFAETRKRKDEF